MKTFSVDHTLLSVNQRRTLDQQNLVRSMIKPVLAEQIAQTMALLDARKEQGTKPETIWTLDREESGTVCIAEWMGH